MSDRLNLTMFQGDTYRHEFTIQDGDSQPIDVSGWTVRMQVRETPASTEKIFEATDAEGDIVVGTTDGKITLQIPGTKTALVQPKSQSYDIETTWPDGTVWSFVYGTVTAVEETTR